MHFEDPLESPQLSELRNSLAANELSPDMERLYLQATLTRVRLRARVWYTWSVIIAIVLTAGYARDHRGLDRVQDLGLAAFSIVPAVAMFLIVWTRLYERMFGSSTVLAMLVFCSTIVDIAGAFAAHHPEAATGLAVDVFAAHFLAGLPFRQAATIDVGMLIAFSAAGVASHVQPALLYYGAAMLVVSAIGASIVHRDVEASYRRSFLEHSLLLTMASRDGLTGLRNRRALDDHLGRVWQQAIRDRRRTGVVLVDIDHFKMFNDEYGHQAGDKAIRQVAHVIEGIARRPLDIAARCGGDEFAVILYDITARGLAVLCESLKLGIEQLNADGDGRSLRLTVSIGAGLVEPDMDRSVVGAIQFADEALYAAKQAGRNCVIIRDVDEYLTSRTGAFRKDVAL